MLEALLIYIESTYPKNLRLCKMLNPLFECILSGQTIPSDLPNWDVIKALEAYDQKHELGVLNPQHKFGILMAPFGSHEWRRTIEHGLRVNKIVHAPSNKGNFQRLDTSSSNVIHPDTL